MGVYSDTTQLHSTRRRVELSCVAINTPSETWPQPQPLWIEIKGTFLLSCIASTNVIQFQWKFQTWSAFVWSCTFSCPVDDCVSVQHYDKTDEAAVVKRATWWGAQRNLMCLTSLVSSAKTELCDHDGLSVILSVCLSVCMQDYYKSKQPISLKLGVIIQTTNQKNWLTFPGYGFRITFPLPNHCGDSRRFTRISHTVSGRFSRHFAKWLMPTR